MASSSSSSSPKSYEYDVFLSFRGTDIRKTFVDHLYEALQRRGIRTFKDDVGLPKGKIIEDQLFRFIEASRFYIILFSKDYPSSSWCLNELVKIMECQKMPEHIAYPVFYDVEPSEVRKQRGPVKEAFAKLRKDKAAKKWRDALKQAGNLAGWVLKNTADGHEAKFIKMIVEYISLELRPINIYTDKKVIGMELRMEKILSSLTNFGVEMIGIKGIGGGGKTTLAKAIFERVSTQFEAKSFVENVREVSKEKGLEFLQNKILSDVLEGANRVIYSVDDGKSIMRTSLRCKKILVVLDDIDDLSQLEALAEEPHWFKDGSRIIITTRDEQVLRAHWVKSHWVHRLHGVHLLSNEEALRLFSMYAFGSEIPDQNYIEQCLEVVAYAGGLPLMIRVLGGFLCGKDKGEWIDQVTRLRTNPLRGTLEKLEWSYDSLENDLKEMFLDVACFLKGFSKNDAIRVLESCGFYPGIGLRVLELKSLITISDDQCLGMHEPIQEMARNIVRRSHPDDPFKHSRLWIRREIEYILAHDLGTEETRAIAFTDSYVELSSAIITKGFKNMMRLRSLNLVSEWEDDLSHWDGRTGGSQNFPIAMRYLRWAFYPHWSLPENFQPVNLVALELPDCKIRHLWEGKEKMVLEKLRFLVLSNSEVRILDLGLTPNLETLDLEGCCHLEVLHTPDGCLKNLDFLNLSGCSKVSNLSFISRLESIKVLSLTRLDLRSFQYIIPGHCNSNLVELRLRNNDIEELPSSIVNLQKLNYLDLRDCIKLTSLPGSICRLRNLKNLKLYSCSLEELPEDIGHLVSLEKLNLSATHIRHLPNSIGMLKCLKKLNLSTCKYLESLPETLGGLECLENLILAKCTRVSCIPNSICQLKCLKYFSVLDCVQLGKMPKELGNLECLEVLNVKGTHIRQLPQSLYLLRGLRIYESKSLLELRGHASTKKWKFNH